MRIIAGKYKRKPITTPPGKDVTRPTSDRVKENIFNILQNKIAQAVVLDLFSGSGALGLECLSRWAQKVIFVEENADAIQCIKENLLSLKTVENYEINHCKVSDFLKSKKNSIHLKATVDLIFADPPYNSNWYSVALKEIEASGFCKKECMVVLEMPVDLEVTENLELANWTLLNNRKYGKTKVEFWSYYDHGE